MAVPPQGQPIKSFCRAWLSACKAGAHGRLRLDFRRSGVKRLMANGNEGSILVLDDAQARWLLEAPLGDMLKGVRDRAILAPYSITASAVTSSVASCLN